MDLAGSQAASQASFHSHTTRSSPLAVFLLNTWKECSNSRSFCVSWKPFPPHRGVHRRGSAPEQSPCAVAEGRGPREVRNHPWRGRAGRQSGLADCRATAHPIAPFGKGGEETRPGGPSTHPQCVSVRLQAPSLLPPFKGKGEVISPEGPSGSCLTFRPSHTHPTSINLPPRLGTRELLKGKGLRRAAAHQEEAQPPAPPSTCPSSCSRQGALHLAAPAPASFPGPSRAAQGSQPLSCSSPAAAVEKPLPCLMRRTHGCFFSWPSGAPTLDSVQSFPHPVPLGGVGPPPTGSVLAAPSPGDQSPERGGLPDSPQRAGEVR